MSVADPIERAAGAADSPAARYRRPFRKRLMHVVRRGHLYFGLFLLPWAVLYGVTGFLFNHPAAFADAPTVTFGRSELDGTPMERLPSPAEVAGQVVAALLARSDPPAVYELVEPEKARYTREFAFATVKAGDTEVSLLFDATGNGGTVRSRVLVPPKPEGRAPFAVGGGLKAGSPKGERGDKAGAGRAAGVNPRKPEAAEQLPLDAPLHERVKAAVPVVLERTGFPGGDVTVTSVPDLSFAMSDGSQVWQVTYNAQSGSVSGKPAAEAEPAEPIPTRRFLLRLHTSHGYPGEQNTRWFWAVIVDVMAFVMVFWAVSGLFMWWQLKAARRWGLLVLLLSAAAATALGFGMHDALSPR